MKTAKTYSTTDVHVAGEAFRIIKEAPFIPYKSLVDLNNQFTQAYSEEIKLLLNEPRGFAGLNGCLVVPPLKREADAAVIFFNHEGTIPLHYGGLVAVITALLECGSIKARETNKYNIETVSGVIPVTAFIKNEEVQSVELEVGKCKAIQRYSSQSGPGLLSHSALVQTDHLYAIFDKADVPFEIEIENLTEINQWAKKKISFLSNENVTARVILLDHSKAEEGKIKTVTFCADGYILRSPGFGTTAACMLSLLSNNSSLVDSTLENESIFNGKLIVNSSKTDEKRYKFTIKSRAYITGMQTFILDPTDPLHAGFLLK